jgi:DNA-binding NtrC family response regulator
MPIVIPALRDRPEDIPILAHHFAHNAAQELHREMSGISPDALAMLQRYDWPGNVRELQHAVERAVILTQGSMLLASSFDTIKAGLTGGRTPMASTHGAVLPAGSVVLRSLDIEEAEATLIKAALDKTGGNRTRAAELLGLTDRTLRNKLARQRAASGEKS